MVCVIPMACQPIYLNPFRESGILSHIARIEELRVFSPDYRDFLLYGPKYPASPGKPINYNAKRVKDRSNAKIGTETEIDYGAVIYPPAVAIIMNGAVLLRHNGIEYPVIEAPASIAKGKKTAFLKAVVRTFMDDPENIRQYIPAAALTRATTQAPAPVASPPAHTMPEDLVERITGSPYPGPGAGSDNPVSDDQVFPGGQDQEYILDGGEVRKV
jgi:hypothetical protein